jgi:predicted nucleic-acid-binding Zn-ribbon protein
LDNVAPEKPCPECGVKRWATNAVIGDPSEDPALQVAIISGARTDKVMPAHNLYCQNCGYIKFYASIIVDKWVEDNG